MTPTAPAWIVDDGPLDTLAAVVTHAVFAGWPRGRYFLADATARAATGRRLPFAAAPCEVFSITMGTPAWNLLYTLRLPSAGTADLAEHEAIAWALLERPDAVFVTSDKGAAALALAELGRGRVAHTFDLWLHLLEERLVSAIEFQQLCESTQRRGTGLPRMPERCTVRYPPGLAGGG